MNRFQASFNHIIK